MLNKIIKYCFHLVVIVCMTGCSSCSKSGQRTAQHPSADTKPFSRSSKVVGDKTVIKMEKVNGVYQIPVQINGIPMFFIFDTGAGLISISATEASFLYKQGKLKDDDVIGTANFTDANGDISEGTIINLKTVQIGKKTLYDIEASVVYNLKAPLLFGQSALEKFGKISIDYQRGEIIFE